MRLIAAGGLPVGVDDSDISTAEVVAQIGPYGGCGNVRGRAILVP